MILYQKQQSPILDRFFFDQVSDFVGFFFRPTVVFDGKSFSTKGFSKLTFLSCEAVAERLQRQCELGLSDIFTSQWKARTVTNG